VYIWKSWLGAFVHGGKRMCVALESNYFLPCVFGAAGLE